MPIARAVSANFIAFLFPVIESYSVVPVFRVFQYPPPEEGLADVMIIHSSLNLQP